jgi:hypothetical protein
MAPGAMGCGARRGARTSFSSCRSSTSLAVKALQAWAVIQLARRLGVFSPSILRVINDSAGGVPANHAFWDLCTAVTHAVVSVWLLPSVVAPTSVSAASLPSLTACAMYYYNPLNLVAALDVVGWRGAAANAAVLLLSVVATGMSTGTRATSEGCGERRGAEKETACEEEEEEEEEEEDATFSAARAGGRVAGRMVGAQLAINCVPALALLADGALRPPSPTLRPSLSLRWYLNAEVFPSFRRYFSSGISVMGALLSCSVALGCVGLGGGRRGTGVDYYYSTRGEPFNLTLGVLAIQAMLWELFATSSGPAVSALWQACVVGMASSSSQVHRTQLMIALYFVATVMNVVAYELWIGDNVGNANFFYGMNMLRGAGVSLWVYQLIKAVRRRVTGGEANDGEANGPGDGNEREKVE